MQCLLLVGLALVATANMSQVPPYPTHPFPVISQALIDEPANRIKHRVELWKSIMNSEMANWHTLSDYAPIRHKLIHELRLGGFAYPWPGVDYYYKSYLIYDTHRSYLYLSFKSRKRRS